MIYYTNDCYLESPDFPFHIMPYKFHADAIAPHKHEFIECVFVAEGAGEHLYRGERFPIAKGDFIVIEPQAEHGYRVTGKAPMEVYNILFLPELLQTELRQLSQVTPFIRFFYLEPMLRVSSDFQYHLNLTVNEGLETRFMLDRILGEYTRKELGYRLYTKAMLMALFISLSRTYEKRVSQPLCAVQDEKAVMDAVCAFLRLHYAKPIMMEQIYQMCGMSPAAFTAKFKQYTGKTFMQYRNEIRIEVARTLLRTSGDKIIHIAQEVGFNDLSHFNKAFKQMTGQTPGKFREIDP